jgi:hypothetical protein
VRCFYDRGVLPGHCDATFGTNDPKLARRDPTRGGSFPCFFQLRPRLPGFPARAELHLGLLQGGRADPAKITIRVMAITSLETRLL